VTPSVADDGSTDETPRILDDYGARRPNLQAIRTVRMLLFEEPAYLAADGMGSTTCPGFDKCGATIA
jgi:glycosyltransferase involved in cell wall biosynthesis